MKKSLFIVLVCLISSTAIFAYGDRPLFKPAGLGVYTSEIDENGIFTILIEAKPALNFTRGSSNKIFVGLNNYEVNDFNKALLQISDKFREWRKIARDNNVTILNKEIDVRIPSLIIVRSLFKKDLSKSITLTARYEIIGSIHRVVLSNEAVSHTDKNYVYLNFSSPEQIEALVRRLNVDEITSKLNKEKNIFDLFK